MCHRTRGVELTSPRTPFGMSVNLLSVSDTPPQNPLMGSAKFLTMLLLMVMLVSLTEPRALVPFPSRVEESMMIWPWADVLTGLCTRVESVIVALAKNTLTAERVNRDCEMARSPPSWPSILESTAVTLVNCNDVLPTKWLTGEFRRTTSETVYGTPLRVLFLQKDSGSPILDRAVANGVAALGEKARSAPPRRIRRRPGCGRPGPR